MILPDFPDTGYRTMKRETQADFTGKFLPVMVFFRGSYWHLPSAGRWYPDRTIVFNPFLTMSCPEIISQNNQENEQAHTL
jgi:hypothetical protein